MNPTYGRLLSGCALMGAACVIALRLGGRPERRAAVLLAACWILTALAEAVTGRQAEPAMIGDAVFGVGLLWLAWRYDRAFLWIMIALEAALFFLHALLYEAGQPADPIQAAGPDALAAIGLAVLAAAAIRSWRLRAGSRSRGMRPD